MLQCGCTVRSEIVLRCCVRRIQSIENTFGRRAVRYPHTPQTSYGRDATCRRHSRLAHQVPKAAVSFAAAAINHACLIPLKWPHLAPIWTAVAIPLLQRFHGGTTNS